MFLVLAKGTPAEGKVYACDGNTMYWSAEYGAYAYLVVSGNSFNTDTAAASIAIAEGEAEVIVYDGDVNETGMTDVNDAQLVYDAYNAKYDNFGTLGMIKFLKGDMNNDYALNVQDAAAIIAIIHG